MKNKTEPILLRLRALRKERGMTISSLAEKTGTDYQQLSRLERGKKQLTLDMLSKLSKALDTPLSEFIDQSQEAARLSKETSHRRVDPNFLYEVHTNLLSVLKENNRQLSDSDAMFLTGDIYNLLYELDVSDEERKKIKGLIIGFVDFFLKKVEGGAIP